MFFSLFKCIRKRIGVGAVLKHPFPGISTVGTECRPAGGHNMFLIKNKGEGFSGFAINSKIPVKPFLVGSVCIALVGLKPYCVTSYAVNFYVTAGKISMDVEIFLLFIAAGNHRK